MFTVCSVQLSENGSPLTPPSSALTSSGEIEREMRKEKLVSGLSLEIGLVKWQWLG